MFKRSALLLCVMLTSGCGKEAKVADVPAAPSPTPGPTQDKDFEARLAAGNLVTSDASHFGAVLTFLSEPVATKPLSFDVDFANTKLEAATSLSDVSVKLWMKVHGHGAPSRDMTVDVTTPHSLRVNGATFIMSGPWEVIVSATVNGKADTVTIPVVIP